MTNSFDELLFRAKRGKRERAPSGQDTPWSRGQTGRWRECNDQQMSEPVQ
ncbi:MAG: hypothetical protein WBD37_15870 [Anderseniella sp.]